MSNIDSNIDMIELAVKLGLSSRVATIASTSTLRQYGPARCAFGRLASINCDAL